MELLDKIIRALDSVEGASASIAIGLEFLFRFIPSEKPMGIIHFGAALAHKVASALDKAASITDKVLPQKMKEPLTNISEKPEAEGEK